MARWVRPDLMRARLAGEPPVDKAALVRTLVDWVRPDGIDEIDDNGRQRLVVHLSEGSFTVDLDAKTVVINN